MEKGRFSLIIIGKEHNITGCKIMADYVFQTIERLCSQVKNRQKGYKAAYRCGLIDEISNTLNRIIEADKKKASSIYGIVVSEELFIKNYLQTQCIKESNYESKTVLRNYLGLHDGKISGKSVRFDRQLYDSGEEVRMLT